MASAAQSDKTSTTNDDKKHPPLFAMWLSLYQSTPKVRVVAGQDIGFLIACVAFLWTVRVCLFQILINVFHWPSDHTNTHEAAACATGIVHSLNLVPNLWYLLRNTGGKIPYSPSAPIKAYPRWWQQGVDAMMQLCCAHMVHDALFGVLLLRYDVATRTLNLTDMDPIYLAHHVVTFAFMMSNLLYGAGQTAGITCMFLGEFTNPVFNGNTVGQLSLGLGDSDCCGGPVADAIRSGLTLVNAILFVPMRGFFMPAFALWITISFFGSSDGQKMNIVLRLVWTILMWGIVVGSLPFVPNEWDLIVQHFTGSDGEGGAEL